MSVDQSRRSLLLSAAGVGGMTAAALAVSMPDAAAAVGTTSWLNVMADFGAKGDGATDDTAAIQAALNAVPVGGVVYFPNGVYEISAPLTVQKAGTKLLGDKASTGYSAGGSNQTTIDALPGFAHPAMIQVAGIADFAMRDLTVHGPSTTGTTVGIQLTRVTAVLGTPDSDLEIGMPGKGLRIAEGANAKIGVTTLNGTTPVTVSTTAVTANSRIFLTIQKPGGTPGGIAYVASHGAGSFSIAGAAGDKSMVAWLIIEPA